MDRKKATKTLPSSQETDFYFICLLTLVIYESIELKKSNKIYNQHGFEINIHCIYITL